MAYHSVLANLANLAMKKHIALLCGVMSCDCRSQAFLVCYAGRFLAGLGVGTASLVVPRYLVEIAPTPIRGALGTVSQVTFLHKCMSICSAGGASWHRLHHCTEACLTCMRAL